MLVAIHGISCLASCQRAALYQMFNRVNTACQFVCIGSHKRLDLPLQVFESAEQELAATGQPPSSRGCKYALNTLMQTLQLKSMALNVAAGPVSPCQYVKLCCRQPLHAHIYTLLGFCHLLNPHVQRGSALTLSHDVHCTYMGSVHI